MVPALWESQLPQSSRERQSTQAHRHAHTCPVSKHTLHAGLVSDKMRSTVSSLQRHGGESGSEADMALAMGDTTPSTNTQQQVPEMKRKSEEKG